MKHTKAQIEQAAEKIATSVKNSMIDELPEMFAALGDKKVKDGVQRFKSSIKIELRRIVENGMIAADAWHVWPNDKHEAEIGVGVLITPPDMLSGIDNGGDTVKA